MSSRIFFIVLINFLCINTVSSFSRREELLQGCSEICNTTILGTPSLYFPEVRKHVNCKQLWGNIHIDDSRPVGPPPQIPIELLDDFTYQGRISILPYKNGILLNDQYSGGKAFQAIWEEDHVEKLKLLCSQGQFAGTYGITDTMLVNYGLLKIRHNVKDKRVLVIGSETPWMESCALAMGAKTVVTLEYGEIDSRHPQIKTFTPAEFRTAYFSNNLEFFDAVLTFSSVEHSGLGRYGDALNPWGDLQTIARAWCVSKPKASLLIGVPNFNLIGVDDNIHFNAHRIYGPLLYSHLAANWRQVWRAGVNYTDQPVYVFERIDDPMNLTSSNHQDDLTATNFVDDLAIIVPFIHQVSEGDEIFYHFVVSVNEENILHASTSYCIKYDIAHNLCSSLVQQASRRQIHWHQFDKFDNEGSSMRDNLFSLHGHDINLKPIGSKNYVFVTAFLDINGSNWQHSFSRSADIYLKNFDKLLQLEMPLIIFIDDKYLSAVMRLVNQRNLNNAFIYLIPINEEFMRTNIRSWSYLEKEASIMASNLYKQRILSRPVPQSPETLYPKYNCLMHSKIDFVVHAIQLNIISVEYFGWIDFGYISENFEVVPFELNPQVLNDHINFLHNALLTVNDSDPVYTLMHAPINVFGSFFFGRRDVMVEYLSLYHGSVQRLHELEVADDDQAVLIQAISQRPSLFKLWKNLNMIESGKYMGVFVAQFLFSVYFRNIPNIALFLRINMMDSDSNDLEVEVRSS